MIKEIQYIIEELAKDMTKKRLRHSIGVMYTAGCMAMRYGISPEDAYYAGILHDCAKETDEDEMIKLCKKDNIIITEHEQKNPYLLHGKAGAYIARKQFGITSEVILNSIRYHTTGRVNMSTLEQIIFVADYIEPNRKMFDGLDEIRYAAFSDLDKACYLVIDNCIKYLNGKGCLNIGAETIETYNFYKQYK